jgi:hypothetical protein
MMSRHLEEDMESPNKPPDDARPAFDDNDDSASLQDLTKCLIASRGATDALGTAHDYAESVSSSTQGDTHADASKRCTYDCICPHV